MMPKLKIKKSPFGDTGEIHDFEYAKQLTYGKGSLVVVEGQVVYSYDELLQVIHKEGFNKDPIEVVLISQMDIGG